jgi:DNA-binding transcriptional MerR regulator
MYSYLVKQLIKLEQSNLNSDELEELMHMLEEKVQELRETLEAYERFVTVKPEPDGTPRSNLDASKRQSLNIANKMLEILEEDVED